MKVLNPTWNNVLIRKIFKDEVSPGGIVLPETSTEHSFPTTATVVKAGPGNVTEEGQLIPMEVSPGDEILIPKFGGSKVEVDGETLYLMPENEIISIIIRN